MQGRCVVCGEVGVMDRSHIKSRGSGGSMDDVNILLLCRVHHSESHNSGWKKFCDKYPVMLLELEARGWAFELEFGVWKLRRYHH